MIVTHWHEEWEATQNPRQDTRSTLGAHQSRWKTRTSETLICNGDAALDLQSKKAQVGMVVREAGGCFVRGAYKGLGLGYVDNALMAEAMGVREALTWLKGNYVCQPIEVEVHCETIF
ncbi:hypothetical protein DM860_006941 [Cuscuta australis]|uniref:RNase H type-1 domain-containing protein n=1 Tax=Cuscuta australis TaxID=267555 RepID=A0A328E9I1_9ASTE|nr:hypothetical protein DM860_006941 [Cuscuta australis]